jgi:hypothetical protein
MALTTQTVVDTVAHRTSLTIATVAATIFRTGLLLEHRSPATWGVVVRCRCLRLTTD